MEKITIVGGGNGAFAASADLTLRGNQVTLFELPQFAGGIKEVMERGGIEMESFAGNGLEEGFAKLYKITTDVKEALAESDIIMVIVPSYSLETIAKLCAPYLRDGQIVALCPANFGGSLFRLCMHDVCLQEELSFFCMGSRIQAQSRRCLIPEQRKRTGI